jgi:ribosomal protein S6--L-glutamate ligase
MERAAARSGVALRWHSEHWIAELEAYGRSRHVVGYNFPLNDAASALLATDKVATSTLLSDNGVPHVPHRLLRWRPHESVSDMAAGLPVPVVLKPLSSSGGRDVCRARTPDRLLSALHALTARYSALAVSPWMPIRHEYRVVVLNGRTELVFEKRCTGARLGAAPDDWDDGVEWRHNLKLGASAVVMDAPDMCGPLGGLARRAMACLGLVFGSVDIVEVDGELAVIEVNSGVCLERFSRQDTVCHAAAQRVYETGVRACFRPR